MAVTFSFSVDQSHTGMYSKAFQSFDESEYVVNISNDDLHGNYVMHGCYPRCDLTIEWKSKSSMLIKVEYYSEKNSKAPLSSHHMFVKDKSSATFNFAKKALTTIVVIDIVPCTSIPKSENNVPSAETNTKSTKSEPVVGERLQQLSADMRNLFLTGGLTDVVLTDGSNEIRAHKLVLSVRSPVFAKMFLYPTKENKENRIIIKDISMEVLKGLLDFMYCGRIVLKDMKMARNLYVAADKYDVTGLKEICSGMLKSVNMDSVIDTLLLADLYRDKSLKDAALKFIATNYSKLKALQDWDDFMKENQSLAIEILSFVLDKKI